MRKRETVSQVTSTMNPGGISFLRAFISFGVGDVEAVVSILFCGVNDLCDIVVCLYCQDFSLLPSSSTWLI